MKKGYDRALGGEVNSVVRNSIENNLNNTEIEIHGYYVHNQGRKSIGLSRMIQVIGTSKAALTDANGCFKIKVKRGDVLLLGGEKLKPVEFKIDRCFIEMSMKKNNYTSNKKGDADCQAISNKPGVAILSIRRHGAKGKHIEADTPVGWWHNYNGGLPRYSNSLSLCD